MSTPSLMLSREGAVATVTLNRPSTRNALDHDLVLSLGSLLPTITGDRSVRAVVLTGAGGAFCSGADLRTGRIGSEGMDRRIGEFHDIIRAIARAPQPFVAAVDGAAVGFGADLALACDLRVFSERGYLQEIFVKIGLMPDGGGTYTLPRLIGAGRALELMLLGEKVEAARALELGIANRVVPSAQLAHEAAALATRLAKGPPLAMERIRRAVRASADGTLDEALDRELRGQVELLASADLVEGVMAWAQKREPEFKGG